MLDQDTARALLTIADEAGARVALVGDRHQLPAVGRGGVLDHAVAWAHPTAVVSPWRRCTGSPTPTTPRSSLRMRRATTPPRSSTRCIAAVDRRPPQRQSNAPPPSPRRERPATSSSPTPASRWPDLNAAIRDQRRADPATGDSAERRSTARRRTDRARGPRRDPPQRPRPRGREPPDLDRHRHRRGRQPDPPRPRARSRWSRRSTPPRFVELAYATTVHGAQGETVDSAHVALGDTTGAAAAYVAMTRGRHSQHRPPGRRDPRGRPEAVGRRLQPRPRRPRPRPRPTARHRRDRPVRRGRRSASNATTPGPGVPAAHLTALRNRPLTSGCSQRLRERR